MRPPPPAATTASSSFFKIAGQSPFSLAKSIPKAPGYPFNGEGISASMK